MCYDITTSGKKGDNPIGESAPNPASPKEQKQQTYKRIAGVADHLNPALGCLFTELRLHTFHNQFIKLNYNKVKVEWQSEWCDPQGMERVVPWHPGSSWAQLGMECWAVEWGGGGRGGGGQGGVSRRRGRGGRAPLKKACWLWWLCWWISVLLVVVYLGSHRKPLLLFSLLVSAT